MPLVGGAVELEAPREGEVLVRVAAAGVCHTDLHLADGQLGAGAPADRARPRGRGRRRGGRRRASPASRRATAVAFCFVPCCRACRACAAGRFNLCETAAAHAWAGTLLDGTSRLALADGPPLQHFNFVSCFAERCVVPAASAVPLPAGAAAVAGGAARLRGGDRRRRRAQRGRVAAGETVCVVGCGGVGLQIVAAARLAGAGQIVAVDRDPAKLELALRARRDRRRRRGAATTPPPPCSRLEPGGVDHAFEAVGSPGDDPPGLGRAAARARRRSSSASRRRASRSRCPRSSCCPRRALRGCYYGSANRRPSSRELAELAADGRFASATSSRTLTDLDGIEAAFDRLRAGEGARTVVVIDPALAGDPPVSGRPPRRSRCDRPSPAAT